DSATDSPVTGQDHLPAELNEPQPVIPAMAAIMVERWQNRVKCNDAVRNACESGDHECNEKCEATLDPCKDTCDDAKHQCDLTCLTVPLRTTVTVFASCDALCSARQTACASRCIGAP
ncbi:hypothetical protein BG006_005067, partial [Podila minutissima]